MGIFDDIVEAAEGAGKEVGRRLEDSPFATSLDKLGRGIDDKLLGGDAADAARDAAATQAAAQQSALDYLKEVDALPRGFREGALTQLGAYYGIGIQPQFDEAGNQTGYQFSEIEATRPDQGQMIEQAQASPLYSAIMSGREAGEEALARRATATGGGLRGGSTTSSLINYNTQLKNQALLDSYAQQQNMEQQKLAGLGQLANLPSMAPQIAQTTSGIGTTLAQGQLGAAQAQQAALGGLLNLGGQFGAAAIASDERLKDNIKMTGPTAHPEIFEYSWVWNDKADKSGSDSGYIAQEVEKVWPDLVIDADNGYKAVYKDQIDARLKEMTNG